jgi:hypothetical protein
MAARKWGVRSSAHLVWLQRGEDVVYVPEGMEPVAQTVCDFVNRHRLGPWQIQMLFRLLREGSVPATASRLIVGGACQYTGKYQKALDRVMTLAGATLVLGPRGGRWSGRWVAPDEFPPREISNRSEERNVPGRDH